MSTNKEIRALFDQVDRHLASGKPLPASRLMEAIGKLPENVRPGVSRTLVIMFAKAGQHGLAREFARISGVSEGLSGHEYVGYLDGFLAYALACAHEGDFEPGALLLSMVSPIRHIDLYKELINAMPSNTCTSDTLLFGYGMWKAQELVSGRSYEDEVAFFEELFRSRLSSDES